MGLFSKMAKSAAFTVLAAAVVNSFAVTVNNPIMYVDSPDPSIVRVDDAYYMVTTTMHFAPGVPVFKSTDLAQWRTVGYAYQTLSNGNNISLNGGQDAYGKGSWASSIRYHKGFFYVLTPSYTTNRTHLYKTADVENGPWSEVQLPFYHDPSLFFDDDGTVWVFYGSGDQISYVQLNDDASGVKAGGKSGKVGGVSVNQVTGTNNYYVQQEGSHMEKVNGEYYLFTISWPAGKSRSEIVYRSKNLLSGFSGRYFLSDNGVAQGGIFDTPDGKWYALLFRDSGPVGRMSHLVPMEWKDGWPVPTSGSKAPATIDLPESPLPGYGMVTSDDFDSDVLPLEWQWNHNPDNKNWSLTANPGFLRITTGRTDSRIVNAKNTLTQRSFGPKSSGRTLVDGKGMKDGDMAGLVALQDDKGFVALAKDGGSYKVVMYSGNKDRESLVKSENLSDSKVYLRIDFDLPIDRGTAYFYYSTDGNTWTKIGNDVKLNYDLHMFVGVRWGLFNFATKTAGGYADFDWFKVGTDYKDEIYLDAAQDTTPPTPYGDVAAKIPGKVEAENYDVGKPNRAYYDKDGDNQGKAYREESVDIVQLDSTDKSKGYAIGYTGEGEWLRYTVNVAETGTYEVKVNMATPSENAGVKLYIDGKAVTDEIIAKQNGESDWSTYSEVSVQTKEIEKGEHALKVEIVGNNVNVDWLQFCLDKCETTSLKGFRYGMDASRTYGVYSLNGSFVGRVDASSSFDVRSKVSSLVKESGVYVVKSLTTGLTHRISVTK
ncbi:MAG: family 43 glycosylhydrolase [Fibrobacter sp.]|uniref:beta-xylosidase family glycoside hydrolase n=1 Tax=Fibrobacter sp. TaxID=35828 RepID=UPI0025BDE392|nr:family 43 glycosylhydrolase [Fibrobacter sp.]MBQ7079604.1 family 43 glycosylhydrolase [Fibrobacter sp.]